MKTAKQIQGDIYAFISSSNLARQISGKVYRNGYRPKDSKREDAVVIFVTGTTGQIEHGIVAINIYFPDIQMKDGTWVEDGRRAEQLESAADEWVAGLTADKSNYKFGLQQTIYTEEEPTIHQHFVVVKLIYDYCG